MYRAYGTRKGVFSIPDLKIGATKPVMPNGIISNEKLLDNFRYFCGLM